MKWRTNIFTITKKKNGLAENTQTYTRIAWNISTLSTENTSQAFLELGWEQIDHLLVIY